MSPRFYSALAAALACGVLAAACSDEDDNNQQGAGSGSGETGGGGETGSGGGTGSGSGSGSGSGTTTESYRVTTLVTSATDPQLINAWGIVGAERVFWIADNGTGRISVYDGAGRPSETYPTGDFSLSNEPITGITRTHSDTVTDTFLIQTGSAAADRSQADFVVASESGKLIAFSDESKKSGVTVADRGSTGAKYKGVAKVDTSTGSVLLAANFTGATVDMFDDQFRLMTNTTHAFVDDEMPAGWGPFNVMTFADRVYVEEAMLGDGGDEKAGPGLGAVAVFDLNGTKVGRLTSPLFNAPWGVALRQVNDAMVLMIGNFGDGRITMIDAKSLAVMGQLLDSNNQPVSYQGLWGLAMGSSDAGDPAALYFTAGPQDEAAGAYGRIDTVVNTTYP